MKRIPSFLILFFLMLYLAGCATSKAKPNQVSANPGESSEDCLELTEGQVLWYSFDASGPVDFMIHYHEGSKMILCEDKKDSAGEKGTYRAPKTQTYCLMWTNKGPAPVNIRYKIQAGIE